MYKRQALHKVNIQLGNDSFIAVILGNDQGRDLYKKKLIRLVEQYRLTKQIRFIDHCKNMPLAYKISDIVVSTSIEPEAFGRVAVEAQSMQKLILASNIGGSNETIIDGKSGILFEAGDPDDLSKKIINEFINEYEKLSSLSRETLEPLIKSLIDKHKTNFKGVGQPLRIALVGSRFGPGLYDVILSLDKAEVLKRLKQI